MKYLFTLFFIYMSSVSLGQQKKPTFNHLARYVQNLSISATFYEHVIGLDSIPEPFHDGKHKWFSVGAGHLHLIEGASEPTLHHKQSHLCLSVPLVEVFVQRLTVAKVAYEDLNGQTNSITTRVDGVKQIYFKDPDGYWIEINDAKN